MAFIGGTGPEGKGLALRLALAGEQAILGSRDGARAQAAADELNRKLGADSIRGMDNASAAAAADIVFIVVPYEAHQQTIDALRPHLERKIVVDVVAPLEFVQGRPRAIIAAEGSAAEQAQKLAPAARVVGAFQNLSARDLQAPERSVDCDVIVCGDDQEAKATVMRLAQKIKGARSIDGGPLYCARYVEQITALLLNIQRNYSKKGGPTIHPSVRIVGMDGGDLHGQSS